MTLLFFLPFRYQVRQFISDFGVLIAILSMVLLDWGIGLPTPKLTVPSTFEVSPHTIARHAQTSYSRVLKLT